MWTVTAFTGGFTAEVNWLGWLGLRVGGHHGPYSLHSSNEPAELSQWLWAMMTLSLVIVIIIQTSTETDMVRCVMCLPEGDQRNNNIHIRMHDHKQ